MFKNFNFVKNFIDDFAVFSSEEDYVKCLRVVFIRVDGVRMGFNSDKCVFAVKKGVMLGYKVSKAGIEVDGVKVLKILVRSAFITVTELESFLVVVQYYKREFLRFVILVRLFFFMFKKEIDFYWSAEC